MDNYMDKLAQRYNAGEMIKANSEADTAEMQNLQEQVEAYEAVLQEMRKLNYKNTELTEKMYSLVDESIEKVRTLQIEASENGANTELISREMSDAVTGALNEALNNMDSTVARTISESLASALAKPTEEIMQSTAVAANVGNKVDSLKESSELLFTSVEEVKDEVRDAVSKISETSRELSTKIDNILEIENNRPADNATELSLTPELVDMLKEVNEKAVQLNEMVTSIREVEMQTNEAVQAVALVEEQNKNLIQTVSLAEEANKESMAAISDRVADIKTSADTFVSGMGDIKNSIDDTAANVLEAKISIEVLGGSVAETKEAVNTVNAGVYNAKESIDAVSACVAETKDSINAVNANVSEAKEMVMISLSEVKEAISSANTGVSFDEEAKNYITSIWNSVEATRNAVNVLNDAPKDNGGNEEVKSMVIELTADSNEIKTAVRNIKLATDEAKTSIKSSFDSAIYGLKQDNKEMVEFMQRMNSTIASVKNDPDKERREEEARQKEEENKKALEERFKINEDFIHKESVKVYRNVQAVINEKSDQQTSGLESKVKTNTAKIDQVKIIAIVAAALSGLSLAAQVLQIFGVL